MKRNILLPNWVKILRIIAGTRESRHWAHKKNTNTDTKNLVKIKGNTENNFVVN